MLTQKEAAKLKRLIGKAVSAATRAGYSSAQFDLVDPRATAKRKTEELKKLGEYLSQITQDGPDSGVAP